MRPEATSFRRGFSAPSFTMIVATAAVLVTLLAGGQAQAQSSGAQDWLSRINGLRASHGLSALIVDANLSDLAQQRADTNARTGLLVHTPNLGFGVTSNWSKLAENIGVGQDHDGLWNAFLNSPTHLSNLLDPTFTHVGIGEAGGPGNVWVVHRFMRLAASAPSGGATAAPPATSAPATRAVVPSTANPTPRRASSGSGGSTGGGSATAGSGQPGTGSAAAAANGAGAGPEDTTNGPSGDAARSPEHVAAVVNVLQALEQ